MPNVRLDELLRQQEEALRQQIRGDLGRRPAHLILDDIEPLVQVQDPRPIVDPFNGMKVQIKMGDDRELNMEPLTLDNPDVRDWVPSASLLKPIKDLRQKEGFQKSKSEAYVGLEFENELLKEEELPRVKNFKVDRDGSLRNFGFEYVLSNPLPLEEALSSTVSLYRALNKLEQKLLCSVRTSTHVHFDVSAYKFQDILTFALAYWLIEPFLSEFAGDHRKGNLFCIRGSDSYDTPGRIFDLLSMVQFHPTARPFELPIFQENLRYGSVNWNAVIKFGSLEFRLFRGTDDIEEVKLWVNTLEDIRQFALKFESPIELMQLFFKKSKVEEWYSRVLSEANYKALLQYVKAPIESLYEETRKVADSFYCITHKWPDLSFEKEIKYAIESRNDEYLKYKKRKNEQIKNAAKAALVHNIPFLGQRQRLVPEQDNLFVRVDAFELDNLAPDIEV